MSDSYEPMDCSLPGSSLLGFPRQEYWSELPFSSPGDLPDPGIEPESPALQADSLLTKLQGKPQANGLHNNKRVNKKRTRILFKYVCMYVIILGTFNIK